MSDNALNSFRKVIGETFFNGLVEGNYYIQRFNEPYSFNIAVKPIEPEPFMFYLMSLTGPLYVELPYDYLENVNDYIVYSRKINVFAASARLKQLYIFA